MAYIESEVPEIRALPAPKRIGSRPIRAEKVVSSERGIIALLPNKQWACDDSRLYGHSRWFFAQQSRLIFGVLRGLATIGLLAPESVEKHIRLVETKEAAKETQRDLEEIKTRLAKVGMKIVPDRKAKTH